MPSGTITADGSSTTTLTVRAAYPLPSGFPGSSMIRYVEVQANAASPAEQVGDWAWSDASGSGALTPSGVLPGLSTNWTMSTDASGTRVLSLRFKHSSSYPNAQNVTYKVVKVQTSPSTTMYNSSETTSFGPWSLIGTLTVLPAPVTISSGSSTVASCGTSYQPTDPDGDGVVNNPNDTNNVGGRGWANLVWPSGGAIAAGYHVYLSDGYTLRQVASITGSGTTSWTTHNAGLYPTDSAIMALSGGTTSNSFLTTATGGLDLRDNPNALYAKTAGTSLDGSGAYDFKVVPYNSIGEAAISQCGTWAATLPNSSLPTSGPQPPVFYSPTPASCATNVGTLVPTISIGTSSTAVIGTVTATVAGVAASATFSPAGASVGTITVAIPGGHLTSGLDAVQVSASNATTTGATSWWFIVAGATLSNPTPSNGATLTTQTNYATCAISAPAGITTSSVTALVDGSVAPVSFASGIASVTLPALLAGTHTVSVTANDNFGIQGPVNLTWSFRAPQPPTLSGPSPDGSSPLATLTPAISISASDELPITSVAATVAGVPASATFSPSGGSAGTIAVAIPGGRLATASNTVQVSAGNGVNSSLTSWQLNVAGPALSNPVPAANTTVTPPTVCATCALSAPAGIATSTLTALVDGAVAPVSLDSGVVAVFIPSLLAGTHTISVSAQDNFGQPGTLVWSFNVLAPPVPVFFGPTPDVGTVVNTLSPTISIGASGTVAITSVTATVAGQPASATFSPAGSCAGTVTVAIPGGRLAGAFAPVQVSAGNYQNSSQTSWWFLVAGPSLTNPLPADGSTLTVPTDYATCALSAPDGIATATVAALVDGNAAPVALASGVASVTLPTLLAGAHTVCVTADDNFGQPNTLTWSFTVPVPPLAVTADASTTASAEWFHESDTNGDFVNDALDDSPDQGRGSVTLSWPVSAGATSYDIYLSDGQTFRQVGSTEATSWSTSGQHIYPSDSVISTLTGTTDPFGGPGGLDLRDDPRPLYAKVASSTLADDPSYEFRVVPRNYMGAPALDGVPVTRVALDNRTVRVAGDPTHTGYDLGGLFGDNAAFRLDEGALTLDVTDLLIPSLGPDVAVSRHYDSSTTSTNRFSAGWTFSFDRKIFFNGDIATYCDAEGDAHVFTLASPGVWVAPNGGTDELTGSSAGWTLTHKDRSLDTFDGQGRLTSTIDNNGNAVSYVWSTNELDILAPNDSLLHRRRIVVSFAGNTITSAVAVTPDGEKTVTYNSDGTTGSVVGPAGTRTYSYDADWHLTGVGVPDFTPSAANQALWQITWGSTGTTMSISNQTGAGTPKMERDIAWDAADRTATVTVSGNPQLLCWNPDGSQSAATNDGTTTVWSFSNYDADGNDIRDVSPTGAVIKANFGPRGDLLTSTDECGRITTYSYDGFDQLLQTTDPKGSTTWITYDSRGNVKTKEQLLDTAGRRSHTEWTYDDTDGRLLTQKTKIDTDTVAETDYLDYADCGKPQSVTAVGVQLELNAIPTNLTAQRAYDQYGAVLSERDPAGVLTASNQYDAAERLEQSTDDTGTVTRYSYGLLGETTSTSRANPATTTVVDWTDSAFNGAGLLASETVRASDGTTVSSSSHSYDDAGLETTLTDSSVPGTEATHYDAQGLVASQTVAGLESTDTTSATRLTYDADGDVVGEVDPGAVTASDTMQRNADGRVRSEHSADGAASAVSYDAAGDVATETESSDVGTVTTAFQTDLAGEPTTETAADGVVSASSYDLNGDLVSSSIGTQTPSNTVRNTLGWVLSQTDANGAVTNFTYDADGRVITTIVTEGARQLVSTTTYDGAGRPVAATNPDGSYSTTAYDVFGRTVLEDQWDTSGAETKRLRSTYDSAGRTSRTVDQISGDTKTFSYAANGLVTVTSSRRGGAAVSTSIYNGVGVLGSVVATDAGAAVNWQVTAIDDAGRVIDATSTTFVQDWRTAYDEAGHPVFGGSVATTQSGDTFNGPRNGIFVPGQSGLTHTYSTATGKKTDDAYAFRFLGRSENNHYDYDVNGRLDSATIGSTSTPEVSSYSYDPVSGAMNGVSSGGTTTTLTYDAVGQLSGMGSRTYAYDDLGHRSSESSGGATDTNYTWAGDRLTKYSAASRSASFTYDATGQRTRSVVTSGSVTTTSSYDYQGTQLLGLSASVSDATTYTVDYLYDERGCVFAGVYGSSNGTALRFMIETSEKGDVRELLDQDGKAFAYYAYDAYGNPTETTTTATSKVTAEQAAAIASRQPLRYASYVYDSVLGLYYLSQRYYDPKTYQFISRDVVKADSEESPYQYCSGDPIQNVDPAGTELLGYMIAMEMHAGMDLDTAYAFHSNGGSRRARENYSRARHKIERRYQARHKTGSPYRDFATQRIKLERTTRRLLRDIRRHAEQARASADEFKYRSDERRAGRFEIVTTPVGPEALGLNHAYVTDSWGSTAEHTEWHAGMDGCLGVRTGNGGGPVDSGAPRPVYLPASMSDDDYKVKMDAYPWHRGLFSPYGIPPFSGDCFAELADAHRRIGVAYPGTSNLRVDNYGLGAYVYPIVRAIR